MCVAMSGGCATHLATDVARGAFVILDHVSAARQVPLSLVRLELEDVDGALHGLMVKLVVRVLGRGGG